VWMGNTPYFVALKVESRPPGPTSVLG